MDGPMCRPYAGAAGATAGVGLGHHYVHEDRLVAGGPENIGFQLRAYMIGIRLCAFVSICTYSGHHIT